MSPDEIIRTREDEKWGCTMILYNPHNDNRTLICKRAPGDRFQPETWGFPGGKVEIGEPVHKAIVREVFEETGFKVEEYTYIGCYVEDGWTDFVFISNKFRGRLNLDPEECSDYRWATIEEIERGYTAYTHLEMFQYAKSSIKFYKDWKSVQAYAAITEARQQVERQYP